jgi:LysR family hydrogen peroxide-inducible transcriptional activator
MLVNFRDLRYALAVADLGSFSRAAEACDVSQPTLSGQIRKLEDELGVELFERAGRRIRVSPAGAIVLAHARDAVAAADDLVHSAAASHDPLAGALRTGIIPTLAPYLLPAILPAIHHAFPAMPLAVAEEPTDRLLHRLADGELDIAILATPPTSGDLAEVTLFDEPLWVALPAGHRKAGMRTLGARDLDDETLLLLADGHCLRDQALAVCSGRPAAPATASDLRAASLETLLNLVAAGYGITIVPAMARDRFGSTPDRPATRPFTDPGAARTIRLVYRPHAPRRIAALRVAETIRGAMAPTVARWGRERHQRT